MSERHREALAHLLYGLQAGGGIVLLTGEIGAGKTTVCRCFLEQVHGPDAGPVAEAAPAPAPRGGPGSAVPPALSGPCRVAYIFNPKLSVIELLQTVCDEFGIAVTPRSAGAPTVKDHIDPLNAFLLEAHAQGWQCVLVIDEAQNLEAQVLEQLRLLTNLETGERKLLQIILIGQPELRALLAQPALEQLAQRVIARYHLGALNRDETLAYLQHRLAVAGRTGPLPFERAALARLHALTGGVPRRINLLADRALLGAYVERRERVSRRIVDTAAAEVFDAGAAPRWRPGAVVAWAGGALLLLAGLALMAGLGVAPSRLLPDRLLPGADSATAAAPAPASAASAPALALASAPATVPVVPEVPAPAVAPQALAAAAPLPLLDPVADWSRLLADEPAAWAALAMVWVPAGQAPGQAQALCGAGSVWQCHRGTQMSLALLRLLDRPGWLTLHDSQGRSARVLLLGLDGRQALLAAGARRWRIDTAALVQLWQGDFATLWQAPPGYAQPLRPGDQGAVVLALTEALQRVQGAAAPAAAERLGPRWGRQLLAFQRAQGLVADGVAGPTTFMQINRALGVAEPRLVAGAIE
ncbi:AAA family ATPase [Aquabacterium sp. OR-4]|nr:AAA family ATPase [Aquabacterium sp. OR-4]MDT7834554.1 AAA family ATPase [Aquabacterium sp. OR-4]